jgi:16S rRNA (guanine1207-N2)-methyltransferase
MFSPYSCSINTLSDPETIFTADPVQLELHRYPVVKGVGLRAWDAADKYLVNELGQLPQTSIGRLVLVNDAFGALTCALHSFSPTNWSDSWMAQHAAELNLQRNNLDLAAVTLLPSTRLPQHGIDTVLMKAPKNHSLLQYQLQCLKPLMNIGSRLWIAGMQKHMSSRLWQLIEAQMGRCITLPGVKKAKLIQVNIDEAFHQVNAPYDLICWDLEVFGLSICSRANLFSREKLDIGTRFLLDHLPASEGKIRIADLGCGNGILGLVAAKQNEQAEVAFFDESWLAVESARDNARQVETAPERLTFHCADGLQTIAPESFDRVLCNPPFHQQHQVGNHLALRMFKQAARALTKQGDLWVVANRHLGYHRSLKRWFKQVELVVSNRKFVILRAKQQHR